MTALCSGLMNPDADLGENGRHEEVSDEQATMYVFPGVQTASRRSGVVRANIGKRGPSIECRIGQVRMSTEPFQHTRI